jgi:hypothetical protein
LRFVEAHANERPLRGRSVIEDLVFGSNFSTILYKLMCLLIIRLRFFAKRVLYTFEILSEGFDHVNEVKMIVKLFTLYFTLGFWHVQYISQFSFIEIYVFDIIIVDMLKQTLFVSPDLHQVFAIAEEFPKFGGVDLEHNKNIIVSSC